VQPIAMTTDNAYTDNTPNPYPSMPDMESLLARDRVLLYIRGMDLNTVHSAELALKSLRRAGSTIPLAKDGTPVPEAERQSPTVEVMDSLYTIMRDMAVPLYITDEHGKKLTCAPPMNRRAVIAQPMNTLRLLPQFKRLATVLAKGFARKQPQQ
jgi:hypothetical protein